MDILENPPYAGTQGIPPSIEQTALYTYSFQEASFARRLQRFCLGHAFHLFIDERSDPQEVY